jgi:hypothetical protein
MARPEFNVTGEIKWRFFGRDNKDPDNPVRHLTPQARDKFRERFFGILSGRKSVRTLVCVADVSDAYGRGYVKTAEDLYAYTCKVVSERFQYYLQDMSRSIGDIQLGILVADHRGKKQDELLRNRHHVLIDRDTAHSSKYANYVETIFLTPSHNSVGIQFADMVAGAISRRANVGDSNTST